MHSEFSGDSEQDIEELVQKCIEKGLKEIAITDHLERDILGMEDKFYLDMPRYTSRVLELKEKYKSKIAIKLGVEIGVQTHTKSFFDEELPKYPFDFIICSAHAIDRIDLYFCKLQEGRTKDEVQDIYFDNILKLVNMYDDFSVFGHIDYVTRYGGPKFRGLNYDRQHDIIDEILRILIKKNKGIEINTSGYRYGEDRFYPIKEIVKRYFELGGEIITIGSDAHKYQDITMEFQKAYDFLKEIGVKYITTFDGRRPSFLSII